MQLDFCPMCFAGVSGNFCPKCGFDVASYEWSDLALKPGTIIAGKYKIGHVLGVGGFGVTYTGCDINTNVRYAIKEFMPNDVALREKSGKIVVANPKDAEVYNKGLEMFLYETNILITLSGTQGIVQAYDFVLENNTGYLIMEYLDGVNLKKILRDKGTISSDFALSVLFEIAGALQVVHSKGLLHRDISPENIMVLNDGTIKLIDFGASRFYVGERSKSLSLILKPGFAPPEQYSASGNQGQWTDIYALAATYYKVVTGVTLPDALTRATNDTVERLDKYYVGVQPHIGKAIHKALALNYRDRYQTIDQFTKALKMDSAPLQRQTPPALDMSQQKTEEQNQTNFFTKFFGRSSSQPSKTQYRPTAQKNNIRTNVTNNVSPGVGVPQPPKPYIRVMSGSINIGLWNIPENTEISVGRDSGICGVVVSGHLISRKHCSVRYDSYSQKFYVVDHSSNGTYFGNGQRMNKLNEYMLDSGSFIMLASQDFIMEVGLK